MKNIHMLLVSGWATDFAIWEPLRTLLIGCKEPHTVEWWEGIDNGLCLESAFEADQNDQIRVGIGWSTGGLLLLEAVANNKTSLDRLVLISSTARMTSDDNYSGVSPKALRAMQMRLSSAPAKVVDDFFVQAFSPSSEKARIELHSQRGQNIDVAKLKRGLQYLEKTDLREKLKKITIPTLVIHGENDAIIPVDNGRYLADHLPESKWVSLQNQGHVLPITASEELAKEIMDFIQ